MTSETEVSVRNGGGPRKMTIIPSNYDYFRFKNDLHFYFMLGAIPLGCIIMYANIFVGPSELAEIPEDYEPQEHEYYQNPIKRWMVKYWYEPPQKSYEKTLHVLQVKNDEKYWNLLQKKVQTLVSDRQDYRGWYWVGVNKGTMDIAQETNIENNRVTGT